MTDRTDTLLTQLTVDEKAALTGGADMWRSTSVPRLGIGAIKMSDGPHGVRGADRGGAVTSACFPVGVCLAATWDTELIKQVGRALGDEARSKGVHVVLGPTINIHRSPLGGRNFECYSEDPLLTGRIAAAFIEGVQSRGVAACAKHYVANDSEFERMTISTEVDERTLREIYLMPFEIAVKEAGVWTVMGAYNRIGGVYACEHERLLRQVLKDEWGFDGVVISDWTATHGTAAALNAGLDIEMPGPPRHFGARVAEAVRAGEIDEAVLDDAAGRLLLLAERTGALEAGEAAPERAQDRPEDRALARRAAAEGMVLLKNDGGLLPFAAADLHTLAVIGPNADVAVVQGGGSSEVAPHYVVAPLDALRARLGEQVRHEPGCDNHRVIPLVPADSIATPEGEPGLRLDYFNSLDLSGAVVHTARATRLRIFWFTDAPPGVNLREFSVRLSGTFTPRQGGTHVFGLTSAGRSRLLIDGAEVIDNWTEQAPGSSFYGSGSGEKAGETVLEAGRSYLISVEYSRAGARGAAGLRLGVQRQLPGHAMERAVEAAAGADAALVIVGTNGDWEAEGADRTDMGLPGRQAELIERVAAANPRTVVVVQSGSPVEMDWADRVPAVLQAWFGGQECGNAIADVVFGDVNPSGRLPITLPRRYEDHPALLSYPGEFGQVRYGEGIFAGYRGYDARGVEPRFAFGHGLSYGSFAYGEPRLVRSLLAPGEDAVAEVEVTNTGARAGADVVQVYVGAPGSRVARPPRSLAAFGRVIMAPGETATVKLVVPARAFAHYDPVWGGWFVEAGEYEVQIGASSRDIRGAVTVRVDADGAVP